MAANGDFTNYEFQVPIIVVTNHTPSQVAKGQNEKLTISFVTDGIENAVSKAKDAAGNGYVTVVGGANVAQQLFKAGLLDEIQIGIMPVLLCEGFSLFEYLGTKHINLEKVKVEESVARTDKAANHSTKLGTRVASVAASAATKEV